VAARRGRTVARAVKAKARQGIEVAREGFDRLKSTTTTLVEDVKDRLRAGEDRQPAP
jgi:hypothetical protein